MKILAILRKSPTKITEISLTDQRRRIDAKIAQDIQEGTLPKDVEVVYASDVCEGDNEEGRTELNAQFRQIDQYGAAYCLNVDRFSRSYIGLKWLSLYFSDGRPLVFVEGMPYMYNDDGTLKEDMYLFFFMQCGFACYELIKIRNRTRAGIDKLSPEERKEKYKGRPKGATDRKKRKTDGYFNILNK